MFTFHLRTINFLHLELYHSSFITASATHTRTVHFCLIIYLSGVNPGKAESVRQNLLGMRQQILHRLEAIPVALPAASKHLMKGQILTGTLNIQGESEKSSPPSRGFLAFFPNDWEFLVKILQVYYTFLSTIDYKILFSYLCNFDGVTPLPC